MLILVAKVSYGLPPEAIVARLGSRLKLLTGGARDLPFRQQTLRNTIDWSYDLLDADERKLQRFEAEHDNLRAALQWSQGLDEAETGLRLATALWRFWEVRGHLGEGRQWLEAMLARSNGTPALRAKALTGAGALARNQGDYQQAAARLGESLALQREVGDKSGIASALNHLGRVLTMRGDYRSAVALFEESLALRRESGESQGMADSLGHLGAALKALGDFERATTLHEESLALRRELGDKRGVAIARISTSRASQPLWMIPTWLTRPLKSSGKR